jgi:hypothetical protein
MVSCLVSMGKAEDSKQLPNFGDGEDLEKGSRSSDCLSTPASSYNL